MMPAADAGLNRHCPVCGEAQSEAHLRKQELRIVRCLKCEMLYANPVTAEMASGEYYDQAGSYYLSPAKLESDYAPVRFERELHLFRNHCTSGSVLDVGCSSGAFLFQLKSRYAGAYELLGIDVSGPALDYAETRGVPVIRGDFPTRDFAGRTFDAVTFWAVLEHLAEPGVFLERAWSVLKPAGLCFVLVPNMRSLAARALGSRYRYIYPQHLNYFTRRTLERLVAPRFKIIECRSTHFNPVILWQDWRSHGAEVSNEDRAQLLQRTTGWKRSRLMGPLKLLHAAAEKGLGAATLADNIALVLRKKPV